MKKFVRDTFWHFVNPVCLAIGIIGILLHFEVPYLYIGIYGLGFWGFTGLQAREIDKKT